MPEPESPIAEERIESSHAHAWRALRIQTIVPEDKRGRVMSYYTIAFVGMAPFGSRLAGTLAHAIGAPLSVILNGAVVLLGGAWFATRLPAVRAAIRPIYREMGILPIEVVTGMTPASLTSWPVATPSMYPYELRGDSCESDSF
jgi:hypothetical protein